MIIRGVKKPTSSLKMSNMIRCKRDTLRIGRSLKQLSLAEVEGGVLKLEVCGCSEKKGGGVNDSLVFCALLLLLIRIRIKGEQAKPTTTHRIPLIIKS